MAMPNPLWPELDYAAWRATAQTLQLWTQIVGKVRLALGPWINHGWHVPLYVTARGLGTSPVFFGAECLEIEFDFIVHRLSIRTSRGGETGFALEPQSVAAFYRRLMASLGELGVAVRIDQMPNEVAEPIRFPEDDVHAAYDSAAAHRFWRALLQADRLLKQFRTGFLGKVSPVHFFWGSFDLAVTRFSGRPAPLHPGGVPNLLDAVTREAYSHEVSSAGFWPGSDAFPEAAFYAYAYPEPKGFRTQAVPVGGFEPKLGEFILRYSEITAARDPDRRVLDFLEATYAAAADLGGWDRASLDCPRGMPRRVRPI
jgi:hypothetical protein